MTRRLIVVIGVVGTIALFGCGVNKRVVHVANEMFPQPWVSADRRAEALVYYYHRDGGMTTRTTYEAYWSDAVKGTKWDILKMVEEQSGHLAKHLPRRPEGFDVTDVPEWLRYPEDRYSFGGNGRRGMSGYTYAACIISLDPVFTIISDAPAGTDQFRTVGDAQVAPQEIAGRMFLPKGFTYGDMCPASERMWSMDEQGRIAPLNFSASGQTAVGVPWGVLQLKKANGRVYVTPVIRPR